MKIRRDSRKQLGWTLLLNLLFAVAVVGFAQTPPAIPPFPVPAQIFPPHEVTIQAKGGSATATYAWTQIYGPATAGITNRTSSITKVTTVTPGTYVFRVTVTDGPLTGYEDYYTTTSTNYREATPKGAVPVTIDVVPNPGELDSQPPVITSVRNSAGVDVLTGKVLMGSTAAGVSLTVAASDNVGVMIATLHVDGYKVAEQGGTGSSQPTSIYIRWAERAVKAGPHHFILRVYDASGNIAEKTWTMTK